MIKFNYVVLVINALNMGLMLLTGLHKLLIFPVIGMTAALIGIHMFKNLVKWDNDENPPS